MKPLKPGYQHWEGRHRPLWHRVLVITEYGVTACLRNKWLRYFVMVAWVSAIAASALLFIVGQLLVPDSFAVKFLGNLSPEVQGMANALVAWLDANPEVSVRAAYNIAFYYYARNLTILAVASVVIVLPFLVTRDLGSNAITIYASKALRQRDYVLGKFGVVGVILGLVWLGPVTAAWVLGNALSPRWHFFWHSRVALFHSWIYIGGGIIFLGVLALAVSALSSRERAPVGIWTGAWILGIPLAVIGRNLDSWVRHLSLGNDMIQFSRYVFRLQQDIALAQTHLPGVPRGTPGWVIPDFDAARWWMIGLVIVAVAFVIRRVRPE